MIRRIITLTTLGLAAVIAVAAVLFAGLSMSARPAMAQTSTQPTSTRQITVIGRSDVAAAPDTAVVHVGVVTEAPTATLALERNSTQVQATLSQLTQAGITRQAIQTTSFNIMPLYDQENPSGTPGSGAAANTITGYRVINMVQITVTDLSRLGDVLAQAVEAGANQVYGIEMRVADRDALLEQARSAAYRDAREQAQQLADASGVRLGAVIVIDSTGGSVRPLPGIQAAESSVPIEPGTEMVQAEVRVTFALQ